MDINKKYLRNFLQDDIINMGFDEDSIDMAIEAFVESFEESFPELINAINSGDMENIRFHAHSLKGTFSNFQNTEFQQISEKFKEIEYAAKESKPIQYINEKFEAIKDSLALWLNI